MLPLNIKIKNFGKLTDADIRIGKFTVFAGANNTGKSFVSKALYSIFGAMNANHLMVTMEPYIKDLQNIANSLNENEKFPQDSVKKLSSAVSRLENIIDSVSANTETEEMTAIQNVLPEISNSVDDILLNLSVLQQKEEDNSATLKEMFSGISIRAFNHEKFRAFKEKSAYDFTSDGLEQEMINNLRCNFQTSKLSDLRGKDDTQIKIHPHEICEINLRNDNIDFDVATKGIHLLQKYSRVLYLESPAFWRIKSSLESLRRNSPRFFLSPETGVIDVPKYVYDLFDALADNYDEEMLCSDVFANLTSEKVLGGKIIISENGDLLFQEKNKTIPLSLAAVGVTNLGMLALLIERNLLDKNTFLFIDEPEAHLHPAWQVEMIEALYALSKAGVNVVIATHSADIMKWIEVYAKKNKEDAENNMEINHFRRGGKVKNGGGELMGKIDAIQADLTDQYFSLFVDGL